MIDMVRPKKRWGAVEADAGPLGNVRRAESRLTTWLLGGAEYEYGNLTYYAIGCFFSSH